MSKSEFLDLRPLFSPSSIAIIGASPESGKPISFYIQNLLKHGYKGKVYPVNPKYTSIQGNKCYSSIHDIPGEIDTVSIALRNTDVLGALKDCAKKGVRSAIVFSAGFAEIGENGKNMQDEIGKLARMSGMRILGPNCNGIMNFNDHTIMSIFFYPDMESTISGEVSLVSQSGTIPLLALARGYERGIGYRCLVSVGNEADLDITDVIEFLTSDEQTKTITGYIEGIKDAKKFMKVADMALMKKKPIVLLPATRYDSSKTAARYHTNAFSEPEYDYEKIFTEKSIITVKTPDELMELGFLFAQSKMPTGDRIGILNTTGGITVLSADVSSEMNLCLPRLSEGTYQLLKSVMKFGTPNNPLDLTGQVAGDPELYGTVLEKFINDENFDILVISMFTLRKEHLKYRIDRLITLSKSTHKPILVLWPGADIGGDLARNMLKAKIPVFGSLHSCLRGVKALIEYSRNIS